MELSIAIPKKKPYDEFIKSLEFDSLPENLVPIFNTDMWTVLTRMESCAWFVFWSETVPYSKFPQPDNPKKIEIYNSIIDKVLVTVSEAGVVFNYRAQVLLTGLFESKYFRTDFEIIKYVIANNNYLDDSNYDLIKRYYTDTLFQLRYVKLIQIINQYETDKQGGVFNRIRMAVSKNSETRVIYMSLDSRMVSILSNSTDPDERKRKTEKIIQDVLDISKQES